MRHFIRYALIALVSQTALLLLLGFVGNAISPAVGVLFQLLLQLYEPMILLFAKFGNAKGESAMIEPVFRGIASGVALYSAIAGVIASLVKRGRL